MKSLPAIIAVCLTAPVLLQAADLGTLQSSFIKRYDEVNGTRNEQLETLQSSYAGALERHLVKIKAGGEIEKAIPVRDEIEAVKANTQPLPEIPKTADPELQNMRTKYLGARSKVVTTHAESLVALADKMDQALEAEEKDLTRNGKLDDAMAAKRMRETLSEDRGIASARKLLDSTSSTIEKEPKEPAKWKLLIKQKMKVEEEGENEVGSLSDVAQGGRRFWNRILTGDAEDPDEILVTPSSCKVSFSPRDAVTELSGKVDTAFPGAQATVRIKAGEKVVFEQEVGGRGGGARVTETFDPAETIEIEVESKGEASAWVYWTNLKTR